MFINQWADRSLRGSQRQYIENAGTCLFMSTALACRISEDKDLSGNGRG